MIPREGQWRSVSLRHCCEIVSGATPRRNIPEYWGGDIAWVTPKDLSDLEVPVLEDTPEKITAKGLASCSAKLLPRGSILFSSRAPIGHIAITGREMCTNQGFKSLVPGPDVDSRYLYRCMRYITPQIVSKGRGATFKEVTKGIVEEVVIPLPPLQEQKRIAAILDKADAIRRKRQQAIELTEQLLRSVFLDMFGDPVANPKGWENRRLAEVCLPKVGVKAGPFGSALKKDSYTDYGYRIYGQEQVIAGTLEVGDYYISEAKYRRLETCAVQTGDLLVSLVGSIGRILVVPEQFEPGIINPRLLRIRVNQNKLTGIFLQNLLKHASIQAELSRHSHGGTMPVLNAAMLKDLAIPIPPLSLQREFETKLSMLEALRSTGESSLDHMGCLFASLVQRAFRGELSAREAA